MAEFFNVESAPVFCNVLWSSFQEAVAARRGAIRLAHCDQCGMIYNVAFEPELLKYVPEYENSLHFSPRFQQYAEGMADRLVERYELRDKDIIEIGCGQGDFLAMLQRRGSNRVLGFDPSYSSDESAALSTGPNVKIICEAYGEQSHNYPADFICCRHVLEHIAEPLEFLKVIRDTIADQKDCIVYFEVPNALYTLRDMGVWDIIYEHCSYFTAQSLANLFVRAGFEPVHITEQYDGQFLAIEACPGVPGATDVSDSDGTDNLIKEFRGAYQKKLSFWKQKLGELHEAQKSVVLWGAGSKAVSFLNTLSIANREIEFVVDLNPRKHGQFIAGTGQQIVAPDVLRKYRPEAVIIMNPIYRREIQNDVRELGLSPEFLVA